MAEFDQAFADKVLIVSARLARKEKFIDMDVIEDVLRIAAEVDAEAAQERRAADIEELAILLCSFQVGLWRDGRHVQQGTPAGWWRPQYEDVKQFYRSQAEYVLTAYRDHAGGGARVQY